MAVTGRPGSLSEFGDMSRLEGLRFAADRVIAASSTRIQPTKLGRVPRNCRFPCGSVATQGWEHRHARLVFSLAWVCRPGEKALIKQKPPSR